MEMWCVEENARHRPKGRSAFSEPCRYPQVSDAEARIVTPEQTPRFAPYGHHVKPVVPPKPSLLRAALGPTLSPEQGNWYPLILVPRFRSVGLPIAHLAATGLTKG